MLKNLSQSRELCFCSDGGMEADMWRTLLVAVVLVISLASSSAYAQAEEEPPYELYTAVVAVPYCSYNSEEIEVLLFNRGPISSEFVFFINYMGETTSITVVSHLSEMLVLPKPTYASQTEAITITGEGYAVSEQVPGCTHRTFLPSLGQ